MEICDAKMNMFKGKEFDLRDWWGGVERSGAVWQLRIRLKSLV